MKLFLGSIKLLEGNGAIYVALHPVIVKNLRVECES